MKKKEPAPSDLADKFMLRFPDGMRERIRAAALLNNRSMNSEIVSCLEENLPKEWEEGELLSPREVQIIQETANQIASKIAEDLALLNATRREETLKTLHKQNKERE